MAAGASEAQHPEVVDKGTNNEAKPHEIKNTDSLAKAETSATTDDQNPFSGSSRRGQI